MDKKTQADKLEASEGQRRPMSYHPQLLHRVCSTYMFNSKYTNAEMEDWLHGYQVKTKCHLCKPPRDTGYPDSSAKCIYTTTATKFEPTRPVCVSSTVRNDTDSTSSTNDILDNLCMRNFGANTAARIAFVRSICIIVDTQLAEQALDDLRI